MTTNPTPPDTHQRPIPHHARQDHGAARKRTLQTKEGRLEQDGRGKLQLHMRNRTNETQEGTHQR